MAPSHRSDEQLVALLRGGNDAAFDEIVRRYEQRLTCYARRLLPGSGTDPEDVVQEALARAYRALPRDRRPMALGAWLHCIVRNCVIDDQRRRAPQATDGGALVGQCPADRAEQRRLFAELMAEVARLPARQREALLLCVFEGRSYAWIADQQGTSVPAVKALVARARIALRLACRDEPPEAVALAA